MTKNELLVHIHLLSNLAYERLQEAKAINPKDYNVGYETGRLDILEEFEKHIKELKP